MMKLALVTLLATLGYTNAVSSCACKADELGFTIDCSAQGIMLDALTYLKDNSCATTCTSESCAKHYYIVQAHHDFCPEADIPEDIEDGFHDYDVACTACDIQRAFTEGAPACPAAVCTDNSGNDAYAKMAEDGCGTDCSSQACKNNFLTLRVVHDDCEHDTLTRASEEGLHDMERACADVLCNAGENADDQTVCVENPHAGHDHGDGAFEWSGVFALADDKHVWSMQKVGGDYADPTMRVVLIPTTNPTIETMETLEESGEEMIESDSCKVVEDGEMMTPASDGSCFELHVNSAADDSMFDIDTSGMKGFVVFAQHFPTEFERDQHYLKDSAGTDIEPVDTEGDDGTSGAATAAITGVAAILIGAAMTII